jgi:hypothetical protein
MQKRFELKSHAWKTLAWTLVTLILAACNTNLTPGTLNPSPTVYVTTPLEAIPEPTDPPACYQTTLPTDISTSYAIQGWQEFATRIGISLEYFFFPEDCPVDHVEWDSQKLLYGNLIPEDQVGLVILNPVDSGTLGALYRHLIQYEYWQMGPEDYPVLLEDKTGVNKNLIFLRYDELNGDDTIIGDPLTVLASLAEHEYVHIAQSHNNPDLAEMVWSDDAYQAFIEGYANIGNASSQRYYFETKSAIETLQNLDQLNRSGSLQSRITTALQDQGMDAARFLAADPPIYDRHIQAFFLRVGGQAYVDALQQGEISPYLLFCRAGSGDLAAYKIIKEILLTAGY